MDHTLNFNLKKPGQDDFYDVDDFNQNAEIIDAELKRATIEREIVLPASGWSGVGIFSQTINVPGIRTEDNPILLEAIPKNTTSAEVKKYRKNFGYIFYGTTENGTASFFAYKKPDMELKGILKGG